MSKLEKSILLFPNIIFGAMLIPYVLLALFALFLLQDPPGSNFINTTLPFFLLFSIYPVCVISSIKFSWRYHRQHRIVLARLFAYSPGFVIFFAYVAYYFYML
jgi:hypothetical protein